ncbi:MAG: hypothetical protein H6974_01080 [Gammaproteobacteria bacterium]|nr:hypothetical protein [Gammaproteobacteria bacterium]MCP5195380.1 hypothetical protein [Gammaproteobacteria bacterium]
MTSTPPADPDIPSLWQYVASADYRPPAVTMEHTVRTGLSAFWQRLRTETPAPETPLKTEAELQSIPDALLEQIAPPLDGGPAALALNEALAAWLDKAHPDQPVVFVIDSPHGIHTAVLQAWAGMREWRVLHPPTANQILERETDWIASWSADSAPWVLPDLERCYLRHAHGLALVRRLLDQACSGALGRGVIGCDSWAWAFLRRAWSGAMPPALTLQSFDWRRLARWFQSLADGSSMDHLVFRQADNGDYVLPPPENTQNESSDISDFLRQLAAYSTGIPGIAHMAWRASLRTIPDEPSADPKTPKESTEQPMTLWVTPWRRLKRPMPTTGLLREHAFVLHTLLLHNGLLAEWLSQLLPLSYPPGLTMLSCLETAGLVEQQHDGFWRVSPLGYPVVRSFLKSEGYLTDDF